MHHLLYLLVYAAASSFTATGNDILPHNCFRINNHLPTQNAAALTVAKLSIQELCRKAAILESLDKLQVAVVLTSSTRLCVTGLTSSDCKHIIVRTSRRLLVIPSSCCCVVPF